MTSLKPDLIELPTSLYHQPTDHSCDRMAKSSNYRISEQLIKYQMFGVCRYALVPETQVWRLECQFSPLVYRGSRLSSLCNTVKQHPYRGPIVLPVFGVCVPLNSPPTHTHTSPPPQLHFPLLLTRATLNTHRPQRAIHARAPTAALCRKPILFN